MSILPRAYLHLPLAWALASVPAAALEPTMKLSVEDPLRPIFRGVTNLPDGSSATLTLMHQDSGYMGQSNLEVVGGRFTTERFSSSGEPLNPGKYTIKITMGFAALQTPQVQAVIGNKGQNLTGPLAIRSKFGQTMFEYNSTQHLGGNADVTLDAAARAKSRAALLQAQINACTETIDLINQMVPAGQQTLGAERSRQIAVCELEARSKAPR